MTNTLQISFVNTETVSTTFIGNTYSYESKYWANLSMFWMLSYFTMIANVQYADLLVMKYGVNLILSPHLVSKWLLLYFLSILVKSYRFAMTWGWVNDDKFHFWVNYPFDYKLQGLKPHCIKLPIFVLGCLGLLWYNWFPVTANFADT